MQQSPEHSAAEDTNDRRQRHVPQQENKRRGNKYVKHKVAVTKRREPLGATDISPFTLTTGREVGDEMRSSAYIWCCRTGGLRIPMCPIATTTTSSEEQTLPQNGLVHNRYGPRRSQPEVRPRPNVATEASIRRFLSSVRRSCYAMNATTCFYWW